MRPPRINLLVIRSPDMDRAVTFYQSLGLSFVRHAHGSGPEHYSTEIDGFVLEVYPTSSKHEAVLTLRLGFQVDDIDLLISELINVGGTLVSKPTTSEWGRRAVIKDLDGNSVELVERAD